MSAVAPKITTAHQLLAAGDIGRCELVRGELIHMTPTGFEHGRLVSRIDTRVRNRVERHRLGEVTGAETGYVVSRDPDTVLAPDVAFVRAERVPREPTPGYFHGAPDLVIEVLSPGDRASEVRAKVAAWLNAGARAVWVVDPVRKSTAVHASGEPIRVVRFPDRVSAGEIVPGFELDLGEIFAA